MEPSSILSQDSSMFSSLYDAEEQSKIFYNQLISYYESNEKFLKILCNEEKPNNVNNQYNFKLAPEIYHLIDYDYLSNWKNYISYEEINKNISANNGGQNIKNLLYKIIKRRINDQYFLPKLCNKKIYYDINIDQNYKPDINPLSKFEIIDDKTWNLFEKEKETFYPGEVKIIQGRNKIIIKTDELNYVVKFFLKNENTFQEFLVTFNPVNNPHKPRIIEDIAKSEITEWMERVKFEPDTKIFTIEYYGVPFDIKLKRIVKSGIHDLHESTFFNIIMDSSIESKIISSSEIKNNNYINKEINSIKEINYVAKIIIQKIRKSSFLISVIQSLSQLVDFADYFFSNNFSDILRRKNLNYNSENEILYEFKEFIVHIWTDPESSIYTPKSFMERLNKINNYYSLKKEEDPYYFLDYILKQLNKELLGSDYEIINYYNEKQKFLLLNNNYLNNIYKANNSIVSKLFMGIFEVNIKCKNPKCVNFKETKKILQEFYSIEIDFKNFLNYLVDTPFDENSLLDCDIEQCLNFYFTKESKQKCYKCQQKSLLLEKKIFSLPKYLIIRLNRGTFDEEKGFEIQKDIKCNENLDMRKYFSISRQKKENEENKGGDKFCIVSIISFPIDNNKKKFVSFCKSKIDSNWYFYIASTKTQCLKTFDYSSFNQSILFYEKEE